MIYKYKGVIHNAEQINRFAHIWEQEVMGKMRKTRKSGNVQMITIETTEGTFSLLQSMIEQLHRLQEAQENPQP